MCIHSIEFKEGDSGDAMEEIEKCYSVMGIPFNKNEIDGAHGIRNPFLDKEQKKKVKSIIVNLSLGKCVLCLIKLDQKIM